MACATAQDPEVDDTGSGTGNKSSVGGGGSGGSGAAANGGTGSTVPLAGTTSIPTAGTTSTGTGGTPGTAGTAAGGTPGTAGTTAAGGSGSSTCPQPYTGTLAKDSTIFKGGFGQSTTGKWSGYGFTFKYGTGTTITPGSGQGCFEGMKMCASGTIPALDSAGAGLGWNISQVQNSSTTMKAAITTPVKVVLAGATAGMRVQLSASATVQYCYTLTATDVGATGATIPLASFKTECWGTEGEAYAGEPIEAIQVVVPGAMAAAKPFDFCVLDIEPG